MIDGKSMPNVSESKAEIRTISLTDDRFLENSSIMVREGWNFSGQNYLVDDLARKGSSGYSDMHCVLESPLRVVQNKIVRISPGIWTIYWKQRSQIRLTLKVNTISRIDGKSMKIALSILVRERRNYLDEIGGRTILSLVRVPGHIEISENEFAVDLTIVLLRRDLVEMWIWNVYLKLL